MRVDRLVCVIPARKRTSSGSPGRTRMDTSLRAHDEIHDDRTLDLTNHCCLRSSAGFFQIQTWRFGRGILSGNSSGTRNQVSVVRSPHCAVKPQSRLLILGPAEGFGITTERFALFAFIRGRSWISVYLRKSEAKKSSYHLNRLCPSVTIFRAASPSAQPAISVFLPSSAL